MQTTFQHIPIALMLAATGAAADIKALVETDRLEVRSQVQLRSIDEDFAYLTDPATDLLERIALDRIIVITQPRDEWGDALPDIGEDRWFIELVDGQRVIAEPTEGEDPDVLSVNLSTFGTAGIPLERVARITRGGADWLAAPALADTVFLLNGDTLTGFVIEIGDALAIELENGDTRTLPLKLVREVRFANETEEPSGWLVTSEDAQAVRASLVQLSESGRFMMRLDPASLGLDSDGEESIDHQWTGLLGMRRGAGVVSLASTTPSAIEPTGSRRWTPDPIVTDRSPPALAQPDLILPAPARVEYPLPPGSDRFACTVSLRISRWSDCIARVVAVDSRGAQTVVSEQRLFADSPTLEISEELPKNTITLVLEVDPGNHGALQDTVTFSRPRVLRSGSAELQ